MSQKEEMIKSWEREIPITLKVLNAFPKEREDFKPHEKSRNAIQLAWMFVIGQITTQRLLDGTFKFPPEFPDPPESWSQLIAAFESESKRTLGKLKEADDSVLSESLHIMDPYAGRPNWIDTEKSYFMWFLLCDHIHHRGQLSVYMRVLGGKVPSIYGPSADESWKPPASASNE